MIFNKVEDMNCHLSEFDVQFGSIIDIKFIVLYFS